MDLSVVIVSWNVADHLHLCLQSLCESLKPSPLQAEIIVVDNASSDGTSQMVEQEFPEAVLIANQENLGFTRGNNQGIEKSQGRYILFLNPDTQVLSDALDTMVAYMEANPQVGALGPRLLDAEGKTLSSRRRFPSLATDFIESTTLGQWFPGHPLIQKYHMADTSNDQIQAIDWAVGAALLVRRQALNEVGLLDEDFFMYSEEVDLCFRLKTKGWEIVYFPEARVVHYEGKSSQQVLTFKHHQFQRSKVLFFRKHHSVWAAEVLRLFILLHYFYQLLVEGTKGILGHKRALRRQRVSAYWKVLRSGLR